MSSVNPKDNAAKLRKRSQDAGSSYASPRGASMGGSFFGKPVAGKSLNPNKNSKSLSNGLGVQVDKEVAGASMINTPNKKRRIGM